MTPMQAAMVAAAVANDGRLMKPYLVDQVRAPDLTVIDRTKAEEFEQARLRRHRRPTDHDDDERRGARHRQGGPDPRRPGRRQDGTAQIGKGIPDHNWFIGFAPADDPKIAVAVFVKNGGGTGGGIAAPIAHDVLQAYLDGHGG